MPNVKRRAGAVVANIGNNRPFLGKGVERLRIGALVDEAALLKRVQEVGTEGRHACDRIGTRARFRRLLAWDRPRVKREAGAGFPRWL